MAPLVHLVILLASVGIIWYFAGSLVESVGRLAHRSCRTGFFTAFFVLGFLTSISEFSVAINATLRHAPGVSAGNLVGASFVLLLLIIPALAIFGRGIRMNEGMPRGVLALVLATVALPVLLLIDGTVTRTEGLLALLAYGTSAYALFRARGPIRACEIEEDASVRSRGFLADAFGILVGAVAIFAAAHFLVEQAVYFAGLLSVPSSLLGLILLSLGTNVPEIVIAVRAIIARRTDIAFGDYLGSAAMNTFIFGSLALGAGMFRLEPSEFVMTGALMLAGLALLYTFSRTKNTISRAEGIVLILFYVAFLSAQAYNVARFAGEGKGTPHDVPVEAAR